MELSINFYLAEIPLFDSLTVSESQELEKHLLFKELEAGSVVYKEGAHGSSVCFVVEGELEVFKVNEMGAEILIASLTKGQSVGEMAIIDGMTRSASVRARSDAKVLILKRDDFNNVIIQDPLIGIKILKALARTLSMTLRDRSDDLARIVLG